MARQYVKVIFNEWDHKSYTYHNDGPPVARGNKVEVETAKGRAAVTVVDVGVVAPSFATKPIVGMAP